MSTTVGVPAWVDMRGNHLFTPLFEHASNRRPRVARLDEMPAGAAQLPAARRVAEQRDDGRRELARIVDACVVETGLDAETFRADGGRYHRPRHGECLEDLQPRAAAGAKRHHVNCP